MESLSFGSLKLSEFGGIKGLAKAHIPAKAEIGFKLQKAPFFMRKSENRFFIALAVLQMLKFLETLNRPIGMIWPAPIN